MSKCNVTPDKISNSLTSVIEKQLIDSNLFIKSSDNTFVLTHPSINKFKEELLNINDFSLSDQDSIYKNYNFQKKLLNNTFETSKLIKLQGIKFNNSIINNNIDKIITSQHQDIIDDFNKKLGDNVLTYNADGSIYLSLTQKVTDKYMLNTDNASEHLADRLREEYLALFSDSRNLMDIDSFISHPALNNPTIEKLIAFALAINPNFNIGIIENMTQEGISLLADNLILLRGDSVNKLSEEISHFYLALLDDTNPIKIKLLKEVLNHEIYQETLKDYKNSEVYKQSGKIDYNKIKLEATAKLIALYIDEAGNGTADETFGKKRGLLRDLINDFIKFLRNIISSTFPIFRENIFDKNIFKEAKDQILNNDFSELNRDNLNNLSSYDSIFYSMVTNNMPEDFELSYLKNYRKFIFFLEKQFKEERLSLLDPEKNKDLSSFALNNDFSIKYNYINYRNILSTIKSELEEKEDKDEYDISAFAKLQMSKTLKDLFINITSLPIALEKTLENLKTKTLDSQQILELLSGYLKMKEYYSDILNEAGNFMLVNGTYFTEKEGLNAKNDIDNLISSALRKMKEVDKSITELSETALLDILEIDSESTFKLFNDYIDELKRNSSKEEIKKLHDLKLLNKVTSMEQVKAIITGKFVYMDENGVKKDFTPISDINTVQSLVFMLSSSTEIGDAPIVSIVKNFFNKVQEAKLVTISQQQSLSRKVNNLLKPLIDKGMGYYDIMKKFQIALSIDYLDPLIKRMFFVTEDDRIKANLKIREYEDFLNNFDNSEEDRKKQREEYNKFLEDHMWRKYTDEYYTFIKEGNDLKFNDNNVNKKIKEIRQQIISLYERYVVDNLVNDIDFETSTSAKIRDLQKELIDIRVSLTINEKEKLDAYFKKLDNFLEIDVEESEKFQKVHKSIWVQNQIKNYENLNTNFPEDLIQKYNGDLNKVRKLLAEVAYINIFTKIEGTDQYKEIVNDIFNSASNQIVSDYYENKIKELELEKANILNNYRLPNSEIFSATILYSENDELLKILNKLEQLKDYKYKYVRVDTSLLEDNQKLKETELTHFLQLLIKDIENRNFDSVFLESFINSDEIEKLKEVENSFLNSKEFKDSSTKSEDLIENTINNLLKILNEQNIQKYSFNRILFNGKLDLKKEELIDFINLYKNNYKEDFTNFSEGLQENLDNYISEVYQIKPEELKENPISKLGEISKRIVSENYQSDVIRNIVNMFIKYKNELNQINNSSQFSEEQKPNISIIETLDIFINTLTNQNNENNYLTVAELEKLYGNSLFLPLLKESITYNYAGNPETIFSYEENLKLKEELIKNYNKTKELSEKFIENFEKYHTLYIDKEGNLHRKIHSFFTIRVPKNPKYINRKVVNFLIKKKIKDKFLTPKINELDPLYLSGQASATVDMNGNFLPRLAKDGGSDEYKMKEYEELKKDPELFALYNLLKTEYYTQQLNIPDRKPDIIMPATTRDKFETKANFKQTSKNYYKTTQELISDSFKYNPQTSNSTEEGNISPVEVDQYSSYKLFHSTNVKLLTKRYLPAERQTDNVFKAILEFIADENNYQAKVNALPYARMMQFNLSKTNENKNTLYNKKRLDVITEFIEGSLYNNAPDSFFNNPKFNPVINFVNSIGSLSLGLFDYIGAGVNYMGGQNLMFIRNAKGFNLFKTVKDHAISVSRSIPYLIQLNADLASRDMSLSKKTAFLVHIGAFSKQIDISDKSSPLARFVSIRENLLLPRTETEYAMGIQLALEIVSQKGKIEHLGKFYDLIDIYEDNFEEYTKEGDKKLKLKDGFPPELYDPITGSYILDLRNKITSWATNIQGNYQEDTLANISRYKAGQLYLFMKKWFFPNMQYVLGYEAPNIFRKEIQGGYANTVILLFKDVINLIKNKQIKNVPSLLSSYLKTDRTKQNLTRTVNHFLLLLAYHYLLLYVLGFDSDDDDKYKKLRKESENKQLAVLSFFKIQSELGTMIPLPFFGLGLKEFANTALQPLRGPYNTTINLSKVIKYFSYTIGEEFGADYGNELHYDKNYGFWFREKGDSKLSATLWKMIGVSGARDNLLGPLADQITGEENNYEGDPTTYLQQLTRTLD